MEKIVLKAEKRAETGKGAARSLRRQGILPAVIYAGGKSTPIQLQRKEIVKLISSGVGEHALLNVELSDDGVKSAERPALIKDYQADPVTNDLLHVDFIEVSLKEKVKVTVPVNIIKEPAGVKLGGILERPLRDIEIECLPTQIPESIDVDAELIEIGQSLHVSDIKPSEGIKIVTDPHEVILNVSEPKVEEVPEEAVEEEAAEPELVKAKGKEEGAEEEPAKEEQKEEKEDKGK